MKYQPLDTLAYYDTAPHLRSISVGDIQVPQVAINCQSYLQGIDTPSPDKYAVSFYAMNHLVMVVRNKFTKHEKLPGWAVQVMDKYNEVLADQGRRMLTYLMLITTREARHASISETRKKELTAKYGEVLLKFLKYTKGSSSDGAVSKFLDEPPKMGMSPYYNGLEEVFRTAQFGGGYGGKPWAEIAKTLAAFVDGKTTMEMMVDTAYTLAHNGGPIFNKGMCFGHYNSDATFKLLDVQRSGQMVEMVVHKQISSLYVESSVRALCQVVYETYPEEFGDEVDWNKVQQWAVSTKHHTPEYSQEIKMMKKQPPKPAKKVKPAKSFGDSLNEHFETAKNPFDDASDTYDEYGQKPKELKIIGNQTVKIVERAK